MPNNPVLATPPQCRCPLKALRTASCLGEHRRGKSQCCQEPSRQEASVQPRHCCRPHTSAPVTRPQRVRGHSTGKNRPLLWRARCSWRLPHRCIPRLPPRHTPHRRPRRSGSCRHNRGIPIPGMCRIRRPRWPRHQSCTPWHRCSPRAHTPGRFRNRPRLHRRPWPRQSILALPPC